LVRFGFRIQQILNFKVISATENSNKFQNTRFWKEKSVEDVVTLEPTAQATIVDMIEYSLFDFNENTIAPSCFQPPCTKETIHRQPLEYVFYEALY
jgi:uncharacterized protein (DUF2225 family)